MRVEDAQERLKRLVRHEEFTRLFAFVGGNGPDEIVVPVTEASKPALEGLWSLADYRMNRAHPIRGKVAKARKRRSLQRSSRSI